MTDRFEVDDLSPPLRTHRVQLRPVDGGSVGAITEMLQHPEVAHRFVFAGATPSSQQVEAFLSERVLAQYAISLEGRVAGLAQCYDVDWASQTAKLLTAVHPSEHRRVWPIEGMLLFVNYLFTSFPLRKLYGEVSQINLVQFNSGTTSLFKSEGLLKDHEWHLGRFWDTTIVSVSRADWSRQTSTARWKRLMSRSGS